MDDKIVFTNHVEDAIDAIVEAMNPSKLFVLCDDNTFLQVLPRLQSISKAVGGATVIQVRNGDINKNVDSLASIWKQLGEGDGTRHSALINLGGGMITDMGAFAAATFKRGIRFINVPTTVLAAVDASVGGKTGINFNGLKNEIGVFKEADAVIISSTFFNTLPAEEIKSGYAEMLKHALISGPQMLTDILKQNIMDIDPERMLSLLKENVQVKRDIVTQDPTEKGLRKALNLGHTVGHAFESLSMKRNSPVPHGYAVAWGIVVELVMSVSKYKFPTDLLRKIADFVFRNYRAFHFSCNDYDELIELMRHDKKNMTTGRINFTLLENPGQLKLDSTVSEEDIKAAFDIYRDELSK